MELLRIVNCPDHKLDTQRALLTDITIGQIFESNLKQEMVVDVHDHILIRPYPNPVREALQQRRLPNLPRLPPTLPNIIQFHQHILLNRLKVLPELDPLILIHHNLIIIHLFRKHLKDGVDIVPVHAPGELAG